MKIEQTELPMPMSSDWMTMRGAAKRLRVHPSTVQRMVADRVLTGYLPIHSPGERVSVILAVAQVEEVAAARGLLRVGRR